MQTSRTKFFRFSTLTGALLVAAVTAGAQGTRPAAQTLAQQVTTALGRGSIDEARRLVESASGPAAQRELAAALLDIFEGRFDQARTRLEPLASANPGGDAALELGLLELSRGRRDRARKLLPPLSQNRTLNSTDDYFRLARAARGVREFQLANDAYQRIEDDPRADVQSEYADLFLQFHQPGDAVTNYRKALEADRGWIPAHIGLSRAYADDEPELSRVALDTARKQAPNHPDVLLLTAERALETDEVPAAKIGAGSAAQGATGDVGGSRAARRHCVPGRRGGGRRAGGRGKRRGASANRAELPDGRSTRGEQVPLRRGGDVRAQGDADRLGRSRRASRARPVPAAHRRREGSARRARSRVEPRSGATA